MSRWTPALLLLLVAAYAPAALAQSPEAGPAPDAADARPLDALTPYAPVEENPVPVEETRAPPEDPIARCAATCPRDRGDSCLGAKCVEPWAWIAMAEEQQARKRNEASRAGHLHLIGGLFAEGIDDYSGMGFLLGARWTRGFDEWWGFFIEGTGGYGTASASRFEDTSIDLGGIVPFNLHAGLSLTFPFGLSLAPILGISYLWYPNRRAEASSIHGGTSVIVIDNAALPTAGAEYGYVTRRGHRIFMRVLLPVGRHGSLNLPYFTLGLGYGL